MTGPTLTAHTVKVDGGYVAGYLVRLSGRDLGKVWPVPGGWRYRTPDGTAFREGDTGSQDAAVAALASTSRADFRARVFPMSQKTTSYQPVEATRVAPRVAAAKPAKPEPVKVETRQVIQWGDGTGHDLTAAVGAALGRHK